MTTKETRPRVVQPGDVFLPEASKDASMPIWLVSDAAPVSALKGEIGDAERKWLETVRFTSAAKKQALVAGGNGKLAGVAFGIGNGAAGEPSGPSELLVGQLAASLPPGAYRLAEA